MITIPNWGFKCSEPLKLKSNPKILIEIIEEHLKDPNSQQGYILDGYPRNLQQVEDLNNLLKKLDQNINVAISITAKKEELISRLIKRKKKSSFAHFLKSA